MHMKKSLSAAGLAAIALLVAAPMTFAQSTTQGPAARPAAPAAQPAQVQPAPAAPAAMPSTPAAPSATQPNPVSPTSPPDRVDPAAQSTAAAPQGCRTRKDVGEACACLSDTSRIGASTADPAGGRNICVRQD
jgi:type IV secretory pathway VirB10-like protein